MSATGQYLTDKKGEKSTVRLPLEDHELRQASLDNLAVITERREKETISHTEFKLSLRGESTKLGASVIATMSVASSLALAAD